MFFAVQTCLIFRLYRAPRAYFKTVLHVYYFKKEVLKQDGRTGDGEVEPENINILSSFSELLRALIFKAL